MWEVEEGYKSQSGADLWPTVVVLKPRESLIAAISWVLQEQKGRFVHS